MRKLLPFFAALLLIAGCTAPAQENSYRQVTAEEAIALIKQNSRRYAKRQLTWFSRAEVVLSIRWGRQPDFEQARRLSTDFLLSRGLS